MKDNLMSQEEIAELYEFIARGDKDAYLFLQLWGVYAHRFDDLVDEKFDVVELIKTNNELTRLLTSVFFHQNGAAILPQIYLAAESYQASETTHKDKFDGIYLSHEGNNMLRTVALITGGYDHLVVVSERIRKLTYKEHPLPCKFEEFKPAETVDFKNLPDKD